MTKFHSCRLAKRHWPVQKQSSNNHSWQTWQIKSRSPDSKVRNKYIIFHKCQLPAFSPPCRYVDMRHVRPDWISRSSKKYAQICLSLTATTASFQFQQWAGKSKKEKSPSAVDHNFIKCPVLKESGHWRKKNIQSVDLFLPVD